MAKYVSQNLFSKLDDKGKTYGISSCPSDDILISFVKSIAAPLLKLNPMSLLKRSSSNYLYLSEKSPLLYLMGGGLHENLLETRSDLSNIEIFGKYHYGII